MVFVCVAFVGVLVPILVPARAIDRLDTTSSELQTGTLNGREGVWEAALATFERHPVTGVGIGASRVAIGRQTGQVKGAHNTLFSVASELGFVGLATFVLLFAAIIGHAYRSGPLERSTALVLAICLLIGLQVRHWEYEKPLWAMFAVLLEFSLMMPGVPTPAAREQAREQRGASIGHD
jgi:O-antigen ligase